MYLLIPGRHQLLTNFQFNYINTLVQEGLQDQKDVYGNPITLQEPIEAVIFAVTSANHSNTRRNPLPFYLRAISIQGFGNQLTIPVYIYGIDDVGNLPNFASYTIKRIRHDSDLQLDINPANTVVICSTPVLTMYAELGYTILPAELTNINTWEYKAPMPWDIVERIANSENWTKDAWISEHIHPASHKVWTQYALGEKVQLLFKDAMIGNDGDLTETRDYNVYVRQMDEIAEMKFDDTARYIQQGRIGDIGCAVGSWIRLACKQEKLRESDFYGVEVSRYLFELCQQRKLNGEFANPFVFFSQKNAVTGLVFEPNSMNTIHTSSLTHEIESYGSREDLLQFIKNRFAELASGGVWINRDVVAPYNKHREVYLWLNDTDGHDQDIFKELEERKELSAHLRGLSTYARFLRFANDFRATEGYKLEYSIEERDGKKFAVTSLQNAAEFMSRKDYTDNWRSEMHETFCFWDFDEWQQQLKDAGFVIHPESAAYTNEWIAEHRWKDKVALFELENGNPVPVSYPPTTMILIGEKQ